MMIDFEQLSIQQLQSDLLTKQYGAQDLFQSLLDKSKEVNKKTNCFINFNARLLDAAESLDRELAIGKTPKGLLWGVPVGVKDMFCTKEMPTTAASRMLEHYQSPFNATLVERLLNNGATILGKHNQDEFAMGSTSRSSYFGAVQNPWDYQRIAGGSSGGSAVASLFSLGLVSLGTDTGGSVRQPAHYCGVFGFKPSYGRLSRYGIIAYVSSLDQAGIFTRNIDDLARGFAALNGADELDSTTVNLKPFSYDKFKAEQKRAAATPHSYWRGKKVGYFQRQWEVVRPEAGAKLNEARDFLLSEGAELVSLDFSYLKYAVSTYYLIACSEASSNLARYDGVRFGHRSKEYLGKPSLNDVDLKSFFSKNRSEAFGWEVKKRILMGTHALSEGFFDQYFVRAAKVRGKIFKEFQDAFKGLQFIISPVTLGLAPKISDMADDPMSLYFDDEFTVPASLAGLPAMSVPLGQSSAGLPVGMQIIAPWFQEQNLLLAADDLVQRSGVRLGVPDVL